MAVAVLDAWGGKTEGAPTGDLTISAGSNRMLVIKYIFENVGAVTYTSLTVGGQAATGELIEKSTIATGQYIWSWFFDEAAITAMSGTTVSLSKSATPALDFWDYATFSGAAGGAEYATSVEETATNSAISTTSASTADDWLVVACNRSSGNRDVTAFDTLTQEWQHNVTMTAAIADGAGGDDTTTLTGDGFSGDWLSQLLHLKSAAGNPMMMRMMFEGHMNG